ncbi:MAG: hypothetical protein DKM22_02150 [Candidatus Melainabacteria bacterium]|nr:MAG: hypothetical protein DKM22_02150 [Candidatus Melainabacteria bacterium]
MKIIEEKNNLARITFDPDQERLFLSSFVTVSDEMQMFIGQIINLEARGEKHFAILKLLFTFDDKGVISAYNGALPSLNSKLEMVKSAELLQLLKSPDSLYFGEIPQEQTSFSLDTKFLNDKVLVCVENDEEKTLFTESFLAQLNEKNQKNVIFDLKGNLEAPHKLVAGKDFKLPLNYDTINFIYEKGLEDASGETKALIQEVFLEVQNYVKTVPEKFIPFENFKSVVDAQYEESNISELVLLKNKLLKFYEQGVFAQVEQDFQALHDALLQYNSIVIDISSFDGVLQREFIAYSYEAMTSLNVDVYCFTEILDDNTDKKLLKQIFTAENVKTILIAPYKYKYLKEVKQLSKNLILFSPIQKQDDFAGYNVFLSKLNHKECIVYGNATHFIPFICLMKELPETVAQEVVDVPENVSNEAKQLEEIVEPLTENDLIQSDEVKMVEEQPTNDMPEETLQNDVIVEDEISDDSENVQEPTATIIDESVDEQIKKDVDEILTVPASSVGNSDESTLTDADLDFIEEGFQQQVENIEEQPQKELQEDLPSMPLDEEMPVQVEQSEPMDPIEPSFSETPIVPVYPAETEKMAESDVLAQGDVVVHEKYGRGVIEKLISYGEKTLCSISFDNSGKKLLDPTVTQLKKM